jgi:hypothetical protein
MAELIPWSDFESEYAEKFSETMGAPAKPFREHVNFVRTDELVKNGNINENKGRNTS